MFDFAWSEIVLIAAVALIAIGPKDMPVAIRAVTTWIKKARRMASEFQTHVDEMVREANLDEVRSQINEIRNFDFRGAVEREIDKDGSIRKTFTEDPIGNPLKDAFETKPAEPGATVTPPPAAAAETVEPASAPPQAPAFVPPSVVAETAPTAPVAAPAPQAAPAPAPASPAAGPGNAA
jgi:sec-independent protein translocase protein TatB